MQAWRFLSRKSLLGQVEKQVVSERCRPWDFLVETHYYGQAETGESLRCTD